MPDAPAPGGPVLGGTAPDGPAADTAAGTGQRTREGGFTLVELLVAMSLFLVVMGAIYGVLLNVQRQSLDIAGRAETIGQTRIGLSQMDRQIRSGNVLYSPLNETVPASCTIGTTPGVDAGPCMRVYTQADGVPRCIQWQVDLTTKVLRTRSWSYDWEEDLADGDDDTDGDITPWAVVARGLQPGSVFTLRGGSTPYGSRLVDIVLRVRDPQSQGAVQDVQTSLSGRNTHYGFDPGICNPVPPPPT